MNRFQRYERTAKGKARRARWRERNQESVRADDRVRAQRVRREKEAYVAAVKLEQGCVDCGYREHLAALELDHVDPATKNGNVSTVLRNGSWDDLRAEVALCEVRCANCHRIKTARQKDFLPRQKVEKSIGQETLW